MRRMLLVLTLAAVMAAMMGIAGPAKADVFFFNDGLFDFRGIFDLFGGGFLHFLRALDFPDFLHGVGHGAKLIDIDINIG